MNKRRIALILAVLLLAPLAARATPVTTDAQADALFKRARAIMAGLGMTVPRDILLKLRTADELNVELHTHGGRSIEADGFYQAYNPETIWIESGHDETRTIATMAHELTHAWQSTNAPLQDRKLTEGFARWAEYHVYLAENAPGRAEALTRDPDPDYGGGLRFLLGLEKKQGPAAVMKFARTQRNIPDGK